MRLLEGLAELLAPTRCAGCDLPGTLLCDACRDGAAAHRRRPTPARAAARPYGALVCTECWDARVRLRGGARARASSTRPLARAVVLHKDAGERRLGGRLGALLGRAGRRAVGRLGGRGRRGSRLRAAALARRGFDHGARARASRSPRRSACPRSRAARAAPAPRPARARPSGSASRNAAGTFCGDGATPARARAARRRRASPPARRWMPRPRRCSRRVRRRCASPSVARAW